MRILQKLAVTAAILALFALIVVLTPVQRAFAAAAVKIQEVLVVNESHEPFQEVHFQSCTGQGGCGANYAVVPAGKRLVLTGVAGYVDVANGTSPNCFLNSSFGGSQYVSAPLPFVKSTVSSIGTRFVINQDLHGSFGAAENPSIFCTLFSTTDNFSGGFQMMVTGYYVDAP